MQVGSPPDAREASWPRVDARRDGSHSASDSRRRSDRPGTVEAATLQVVPGTRCRRLANKDVKYSRHFRTDLLPIIFGVMYPIASIFQTTIII